MANKITTPSYLIKRLRESGYIVIRLFGKYSITDQRKWTVMVDPGGASIAITCYENYPSLGDITFEFNDGGTRWPRNYMLTTRSIEVIIMALLEKEVPTYSKDSIFFQQKIHEFASSKK